MQERRNAAVRFRRPIAAQQPNRIRLPMMGMAEMMLVPTVIAQNASWSQGSR